MQRRVRPLKANVHDAAESWDGRASEDGWASKRDGESDRMDRPLTWTGLRRTDRPLTWDSGGSEDRRASEDHDGFLRTIWPPQHRQASKDGQTGLTGFCL